MSFLDMNAPAKVKNMFLRLIDSRAKAYGIEPWAFKNIDYSFQFDDTVTLAEADALVKQLMWQISDAAQSDKSVDINGKQIKAKLFMSKTDPAIYDKTIDAFGELSPPKKEPTGFTDVLSQFTNEPLLIPLYAAFAVSAVFALIAIAKRKDNFKSIAKTITGGVGKSFFNVGKIGNKIYERFK